MKSVGGRLRVQNILSRRSPLIEFLFLPIIPIEQDSLIFSVRIDFAPSDGEIDRLAITIGSRNLTKQLAPRKTLKRVRGLQAKSNESPMTHRLNSPHEWLLEKAQHWNTDALYKALSGLAYRLDGHSIRDLFHSEMDSDGFFDEKTRSSADEFDAESWGSHRWHT